MNLDVLFLQPNKIRILLLALSHVSLFGMQTIQAQHTNSTAGYQEEIEQWRRQRIIELKAEEGWLNLAGLFWLKPGRNSFGTDSSNDLRFPEGTTSSQAGQFLLKDTLVYLIPSPSAVIILNGIPLNDTAATLIFQPGKAATVLASGSLRFHVIRRGEKTGIRLRNLNSESVQKFKGISTFPVDTGFRIEAKFIEASLYHTIPVTNVLGQTILQRSPGKLVFTFNGVQYQLDALEEGDHLFIIFGDETNGRETYGSGRFLLAKRPDKDGKTILDFNKAYNPPCAYTPFATCPLPPAQNNLPVKITAGERYEQHQP